MSDSRKEEEDRIKETERQLRVTTANLAGASNLSPKASEPGARFVKSTPELSNIWSNGPGGEANGGPKNMREEMEKEIKDRERQFRTAKPGAVAVVSGSVAVSEPDASGSFTVPSTSSASSNAWGTKKTSSQAPSAASRSPSMSPPRRDIFTAGALQNAAPDVVSVEVSAGSVNGTNITESSGASSVKSRVEEDERIKAFERHNRTARISNLAGSIEGTPGDGPTYIDDPGTPNVVVEEDDRVKVRERQSEATRGEFLPGVVAYSSVRAPAAVPISIEAPQTQNPDSDMMIKQRATLTVTRGSGQFQAVVSEAYTANPAVDRSVISSRDSTLPEKSLTGPRMHGVGAIAAMGEGELQRGKSTQPGVVRDDNVAEGMIRAKRGRHEASRGTSNTTSTFDYSQVQSNSQFEDVEVPTESVGQPEDELSHRGAFRVFTNDIIIRQEPGILSDQVQMRSAAFSPPDIEKPNDGPTTDLAETGFIPDNRDINILGDIDNTDNEGKPENVVPFYKSRTFSALIGIVVLAAIAIGVGVALSGGGDDGLTLTPTAAPTEDPIYQERETYLILFLETEGLDVESLEDPSSYQSAALNWIVKDDEISRLAENSTDEEMQVALSRYVLAVFYYSLNGSSWISDSGWLDATLGHCSWEFISCDGAGLITSISTGSFLEYLAAGLGTFQAALAHGGNHLEGILPSEFKHFTSLGECIMFHDLSFVSNALELTLFRVS
jgi:hypothetical protein